MIKKFIEDLIEFVTSLVEAIIEIGRRIRKFITDLIKTALAFVTRLAAALKQIMNDLLESIAKLLSDILNVLKKMLLDVLKACKDALKAVLDFATKFIAAFGEFMMILVDILSDPGGWLSGAKNSAYDGAKNHLFNEVKSAVKQWFNDKVKEITGLTEAVWNKLMKGGWTLEKIAKEVWDAIVPQLPFIIGEIVITKVLAKLIPGAGWGAAILEAIQAAIGSLGEILKAIGAVITWLKSVRQGGAGVLFAKAIAAGIVVLLEMAYELILSGIGKYVSKVGKRLKGVAANMGKDKDKGGGGTDKGKDGQGGDDKGGDKGRNDGRSGPGTQNKDDKPAGTSTPANTTKGNRQDPANQHAANVPGNPGKPRRGAPNPTDKGKTGVTTKNDKGGDGKGDNKGPDKDTQVTSTTKPTTKPTKPSTKNDKSEGNDKTPSNKSTKPTPPTSKDKNGNPKNENKGDKKDTRPTPSPKPTTPTPKPNKTDGPSGPTKDNTKSNDDKGQGPDNSNRTDPDGNKDKADPDGNGKKDPEGSDKKDTNDSDTKDGKGKSDTDGKAKKDSDGSGKKDGNGGNRKGNTNSSKNQKREERNEEENSDSSKNAQLALIVARLREILREKLDDGLATSTHKGLLAGLKRHFKLTALNRIGTDDDFTVMATLNPHRPVIRGKNNLQGDTKDYLYVFADPKLPATRVPGFADTEKPAKDFEAQYITKKYANNHGSDANEADEHQPIGFRHLNLHTLNTDSSNWWVRMHLLSEQLGGPALGTNLVPARGPSVNTKFKNDIEEPAYSYLGVNKSEPNERAIWYRVRVNYHPGPYEGFPSYLQARWGRHELQRHKNTSKWVTMDASKGAPHELHVTPEKPPNPGKKTITMNSATKGQIKALLKTTPEFAQLTYDAITDYQSNSRKEVKGVASLVSIVKRYEDKRMLAGGRSTSYFRDLEKHLNNIVQRGATLPF